MTTTIPTRDELLLQTFTGQPAFGYASAINAWHTQIALVESRNRYPSDSNQYAVIDFHIRENAPEAFAGEIEYNVRELTFAAIEAGENIRLSRMFDSHQHAHSAYTYYGATIANRRKTEIAQYIYNNTVAVSGLINNTGWDTLRLNWTQNTLTWANDAGTSADASEPGTTSIVQHKVLKPAAEVTEEGEANSITFHGDNGLVLTNLNFGGRTSSTLWTSQPASGYSVRATAHFLKYRPPADSNDEVNERGEREIPFDVDLSDDTANRIRIIQDNIARAPQDRSHPDFSGVETRDRTLLSISIDIVYTGTSS